MSDGVAVFMYGSKLIYKFNRILKFKRASFAFKTCHHPSSSSWLPATLEAKSREGENAHTLSVIISTVLRQVQLGETHLT
jgi:hypothetical protein